MYNAIGSNKYTIYQYPVSGIESGIYLSIQNSTLDKSIYRSFVDETVPNAGVRSTLRGVTLVARERILLKTKE